MLRATVSHPTGIPPASRVYCGTCYPPGGINQAIQSYSEAYIAPGIRYDISRILEILEHEIS